MARGTRQHPGAYVAISADDGLRAALRGRAGAGRPAWIVLADPEAAAAAIAGGEYTNLPEITSMLAANETLPAGIPDLYTAVAEQLMIRVEIDPSSREAAMVYAGALQRRTTPDSMTSCAALLRSLAQAAVDEADQAPSGPRYVTRELLVGSGVSTPPSVSQQADTLTAETAFNLPAQVQTLMILGDDPSYAQVLESARAQLRRRSAAALHARLKRAPRMYGDWIRQAPTAELPELDQLQDALRVAASSETTQDATEAFRTRLADLAA